MCSGLCARVFSELTWRLKVSFIIRLVCPWIKPQRYSMDCWESVFNMANCHRVWELLVDRCSTTIHNICRMRQGGVMDCDVRESVIFRLNSLRHLVVRCADIAILPEVNLCLQRVVSILSDGIRTSFWSFFFWGIQLTDGLGNWLSLNWIWSCLDNRKHFAVKLTKTKLMRTFPLCVTVNALTRMPCFFLSYGTRVNLECLMTNYSCCLISSGGFAC